MLDADQCVRQSYDDGSKSLKVTLVGEVLPVGGGLEVSIDATDDSIKIGDGAGHYAAVNPDGSLNVNINSSTSTVFTTVSTFNEVTSVASGITTNVVSYTIPALKKGILQQVSVSGENIAKFDVLVNAARIDTQRSFFGNLNARFDFVLGINEGFNLNSGDVVLVQVIHNRPSLANFNGRIQVLTY